ncbi:acyltransferase [Gemmata sp. G18]|uniref:Acyltransferase n=1 Tax=Gemmata palustris TaxID=2822762 RepID=A0ABS5BSG7_9BACT|nr:acyltransferase [Gemmata palustris]MBP3956591.1 acyltransferase [Gemmata palustris]
MAPPPSPSRYESLDVWRGAACLLVVALHATVYSANESFDARVRSEGGSVFEWVLVAAGRLWIGVPLFFVISGYCIAASADAVRARPGGVGRYFVRRARRIYPPLWAALVLAVAVMFLLPPFAQPAPTSEGAVPLAPPAHLTVWQWVGNATLTESWRAALAGGPTGYVLGQLWTLCYEEQFYIVMGAILLIARRWFFPGVWLVTALVLFNLSSLTPYPVRPAGLFTDGLWIAFAAGVAVYYRLIHAPATTGASIEFALLIFGATALAGEADPFDTRQTLAKYNAVACGFAVLLCRLRRFDSALATSRWTAPLRFCGRMCYSLYLTHPLVAVPIAWMCSRAGVATPALTVLVTLPLCMVSAAGLGYAFHRVVERRFLGPSRAPGAG